MSPGVSGKVSGRRKKYKVGWKRGKDGVMKNGKYFYNSGDEKQ